jgi:phage tail protein X
MTAYTTVQGDTFDWIAKKCCGSELLMGKIIDTNPAYGSVMVFPAGITLSIPDISSGEEASSTVPPWRQSDGS